MGWWYQSGSQKTKVVVLIGLSLLLSVLLHSLTNQVGLESGLGMVLSDHGMSQNILLLVLFLTSVVGSGVFVYFKGRKDKASDK